MHEILFRGFHPCENGDTTIYVDGKAVIGQWVEGWYQQITKGYNGAYGNVALITTFKKLDNGEIVLTGIFDVLFSTVGQYTGLADKNEAKIFESDILKLENFNVQVEWQIDAWCVRGGYLTGDSLCGYNEQGEIIGTIWCKEPNDNN